MICKIYTEENDNPLNIEGLDDCESINLETINYIEQLINTSTFDDEQKAQFERELSDISNQKADELITLLKLNQVNRIESGNNYDQSDIKEQLNRHCC